MSPLTTIARSWSLDPWIVVPLVVTAAVYGRGYARLRRRGLREIGPRHRWMFLAGLATLWLALLSPLEPLSALLLVAHMTQHMLLILVAPVLLLLGRPELPLLAGLPRWVRRDCVGPVLALSPLRACFAFLVLPVVAWVLHTVATWAWHVPSLYELALRSRGWHEVEHACFFGTALLFWWVVILPYPSRAAFSRWLLLPYLFLAGVQGTVLAAILTFSGRVLYPHYESMPRVTSLTPLDDQAVAGAVMWVAGSLVYLLPLVLVGWELMVGKSESGKRKAVASPVASPLPSSHPLSAFRSPLSLSFDLLRVPLLGRFLRWRKSRLVVQAPMFGLAGLIVLDGWFGSQVAPLNLAGVLPWIHWRGLLVLTLLVAGNFFCFACPFTLPRSLGRRWLPGGRAWPAALRSKWLAVALLVLFFWAYEVFALWDTPWWTAWIVVMYFVAAALVEGFFREGTFCKYVCPVGQFNFVQSLVSPLEVRVREPAVCTTCTTHDCLHGNAQGPGCGLNLFQPRKVGNFDCTFCLQCVHACPQQNVGILASQPLVQLSADPLRSGLGRLSERTDVAVLVLVLVFAAFANAAGMVEPVLRWEADRTARLGLSTAGPMASVGLLLGMIVLPAMLVSAATLLSRRFSSDRTSPLAVARRFAFALLPLGCAMWVAHYSFHLFTSAGTILPAGERALADLGLVGGNVFVGGCNCGARVADWLLRAEILCLDAGLLASLYIGYRIARRTSATPALAARAFAPWSAIMLLLFAVGIWIVFQPMQMRGTM